jgi:hypothetical protein
MTKWLSSHESWKTNSVIGLDCIAEINSMNILFIYGAVAGSYVHGNEPLDSTKNR